MTQDQTYILQAPLPGMQSGTEGLLNLDNGVYFIVSGKWYDLSCFNPFKIEYWFKEKGRGGEI